MEASAPPPVASVAYVSRSTPAICASSFRSVRGSSLRNRHTSTSRSRRTTTTSSPRWPGVETMASGCVSRRRSIKACAIEPQTSLDFPKRAAGASRPLAAQEPLLLFLVGVLELARLFHGVELVALRVDLLLQDLEPVEHLLRARWAARHVHVHGDNADGALRGGVVVVEAARRGADAEGHHPLGLGHLLVDALEHGRLLHVDGAYDHEQIRLARGEARVLGAEAGQVVAARHDAHVLHAAAGGDERVLEEGVRARPAQRAGELAL